MFKFMKKIFGKKEANILKEYVFIVDDNYVLVTRGEKTTIEHRDKYKFLFEPSASRVRKNGKWGIINQQGIQLIPVECDNSRIDGDEVVILRNGKLEKFSLSELLKEEN